MIAPAMLVAVTSLPPVPAGFLASIAVETTNVNETTSTFSGIAIPATALPHPNRVIVLRTYHGVAAACTATVNGIPPYATVQDPTHEFSLHCFQVPNGMTIDVTVSAVGSQRKAFTAFVMYPEHHELVDSGTASAAGTTNATVADMKMLGAKATVPTTSPLSRGGIMCYSGGQNATIGTFTTTFTGAATVSEFTDSQYEGAASWTAGVAVVVAGTDTATDANDVVLAESASGVKRLAVATFWPPKR